jgi:hypothetical protein
MTPTEEQILRNQIAILNLLKHVTPANEEGTVSLELGLQCIGETGRMLETEGQQGRTIHVYSP